MFEPSRYLAMASENGPHRARIEEHTQEWAAWRAALLGPDDATAKSYLPYSARDCAPHNLPSRSVQ